ncbi:MAG: DUF2066 domain-containing protein [Gammaproteobacteria bacterium]|nr:hypothetical protein [Gammaproteobacteria bacterium]
MSAFSCRTLRLVALALLCAPVLVYAITVEDLYETSQPVEGSQDAAFVEALKTVVVKVSGRRDAPERLGAALGNARQLVQRYGITQENVLQVGFDDRSVDRLLTEAGLPIWGRERPSTLVAVALDELGGVWLSHELPPEDKERLSFAASRRGLPLQWVSLDARDESFLTMGEGAAAALLQLAQRNGANAVLLGRGSRNGALRWVLATSDGLIQSTGTYEDAVDATADHFAKLFATEASSLSRVNVQVSGLADLDAYAATLNYLESMTLVRSVAVREVVGDTIRFELAIRGSPQTLQRAIALDHRLVPVETSSLAARGTAAAANVDLAFRYQP